MTDAVRADTSGLGYLINQTARALRLQLAKNLRDHGLDDSDYIVLQNVVGAASAHKQVKAAEIAERNNVPAEEVDQSVAKLARDGWLEMGRGHEESLTPTAKTLRVMPGLRDSARWMLERALSGFSRQEIEELSAQMTRMIGNLK